MRRALGLDAGDRTIGVAVSDLLGFTAQGVETIRRTNLENDLKRLQELMSALAVGDTVKTTSGFYGVIIDITDDMVIVEFGNNKNCRIPMDKAAITDVEKPEE